MIVDRLENPAARLGESGEGGWYRERGGENCWGNSLHPSLFPSAIKTHRCALQNITNITFSSTNSVCIQSLTSVEALQKISMKIRGNVVILTRPSHITTQNMLQFLLWIIKDKKSKWSWYRTTHRLIWGGGIDLKFNKHECPQWIVQPWREDKSASPTKFHTISHTFIAYSSYPTASHCPR